METDHTLPSQRRKAGMTAVRCHILRDRSIYGMRQSEYFKSLLIVVYNGIFFLIFSSVVVLGKRMWLFCDFFSPGKNCVILPLAYLIPGHASASTPVSNNRWLLSSTT